MDPRPLAVRLQRGFNLTHFGIYLQSEGPVSPNFFPVTVEIWVQSPFPQFQDPFMIHLLIWHFHGTLQQVEGSSCSLCTDVRVVTAVKDVRQFFSCQEKNLQVRENVWSDNAWVLRGEVQVRQLCWLCPLQCAHLKWDAQSVAADLLMAWR